MAIRWKIRTLILLVVGMGVTLAFYRYYDQVLSKKTLQFRDRLIYEHRLQRTLSGTSDFLKYQAKQLESAGKSDEATALISQAKACDIGAAYHAGQVRGFNSRGSIPWTAAFPDLNDPCPVH